MFWGDPESPEFVRKPFCKNPVWPRNILLFYHKRALQYQLRDDQVMLVAALRTCKM